MNTSLDQTTNKLLLYSFLSICLSYVFCLSGPLLIEVGGLPASQAAWVLAGISVAVGIVQPYFGKLIDNNRWLLMIVVTYSGIGFGMGVFISSTSNFWMICLGIVSLQLGYGTFVTVFRQTTLGPLSGKRREHAANLMFLVFNLAAGFSAIVAWFFLEKHKLVLLWSDLLSTFLVVGATLKIAYKAKSRVKSQKSLRKGRALATIGRAMQKNPGDIAIIGFLEASYCSAIIFAPLFFSQNGIAPTKHTTLLLAANCLGVIAFGWILKSKIAVLSRHVLTLLASMAFTAALLLTPQLNSLGGILGVGIVLALGEVFFARVAIAMLLDCFDESDQGIASGFASGLFSVTKVIAPIMAMSLMALQSHLDAPLIELAPLTAGLLFSWSNLAAPRRLKHLAKTAPGQA